VHSLQDVLEEARMIDALGTGITGGEPLLKLDTVLKYIRSLKAELGEEHHIHLYTGTLPQRTVLLRLKEAGLDEIRVHPALETPKMMAELEETLREAVSLELEAGVEIPSLKPAPRILEIIKKTGAFLNLNELEFSETNQDQLKAMGFQPQDKCFGALGSKEVAENNFMDDGAKVHYCSSSFKDAVQLRERFKRRARRVARSFEEITEDGTLILGTIEGRISEAADILTQLEVPKSMYAVMGDRIEMAAWVLEEIYPRLKRQGCHPTIEERYPTGDGQVVERIPL
jgi:pyruvate formate-lyase activating enzyme-like uncharacterized protein